MADGAGAAVASIRILRVAPPPAALVDDVCTRLGRCVSVPCRVDDAAPAMDVPYIPGRGQADADRLLELVEQDECADGEIVVALTALDVGNPIFTHFFGLARQGGAAALVSTARLTPVFYGLPDDHVLTARRAVLEILHELGHVVGLGHCDDFGCLMRFAPVVEQIDNRGQVFCARCSPGLPAAFGPACVL